jgi:hypothetical protein
MIELLKKGVKFVWSEACERAFHTLRQQLTSAPVLVQPDNSKPFEVSLCKKDESLPMLHGLFDLMKSIILPTILS